MSVSKYFMPSWTLIWFLVLLFMTNDLILAQPRLTTGDKRAARAYREAVEFYGHRRYQQAEKALLDAVGRDDRFVEAWLLLGDLRQDMKDVEGTIQAYQKAIATDPSFFPRAIFVVAQLHRASGRYEQASQYYQLFLGEASGRHADRQAAELGLASSFFAIEAMENPVPFNPENLGEGVNGPYDEFVNAISTDKNMLLFTRKHPSGKYFQDGRPLLVEDFFKAVYQGDKYDSARPLGPPINTDGNEGALSISADNRYLFFAGCNRKDGMGSCDIYYAVADGPTWRVPRNLGSPVNSNRWDSHPSFSADNRTLYYASSRGGGKGKSDIWMSTVGEDGFWSDPVNLGDAINTPGQEVSPLIHPDGQTLYFASDGHPGMGGLDLFISRKGADGKWGQPVNLGYPINTVNDELSLVVDARGEWAYFSSDKFGGQGGYDIYRFLLPSDNRPQPVTYMKGRVFDSDDRRPIKAAFELVDLETGRKVVSAGSDPSTGEFLVCIPTGKSYALLVDALGYLYYSEHFALSGSADIMDPVLKDIALQLIKPGQAVVMRNVFFETASFALLPASLVELDHLVDLLKTNPGIHIEIGGHTDNIGTAEFNRQLSENRAASVLKYLVEKGVNENRLAAVGYGFSKPLASNDTEEGRAQNRRTAFIITRSSR